jgi:phosphoribosylamine--glycine ligase
VAPRTGDVIEGVADAAAVDGAFVFHAGTRREGDVLVTAGGRVFAVSALGSSIPDARARAYEAADHITWSGRQCRRDIAAGV